MSAVSNRETPWSRQISTRCSAPFTSVDPQALKNSFEPPKVAVPKLKTGTRRPERPSLRYSIFCSSQVLEPARYGCLRQFPELGGKEKARERSRAFSVA